ncbi:MAG: hypothetical protein ACOVQA_12910 [Thermoflexibacteraceae bacterium]
MRSIVLPHPALPTQLLPEGRGICNYLIINSPPCGEGWGGALRNLRYLHKL